MYDCILSSIQTNQEPTCLNMNSSVPKWLISLLTEKFYNACILHEEDFKNEKNIFCVDCCEAICPHCCNLHTAHRFLKIRRYVYCDVIRVSDGDKFMECKHVQTYTTNSAKVIFLNQRPQTGQQRDSGLGCLTCLRKIHHPFRYCSISCKFEYLLKTGCKLSKYLRRCEPLTIPNPVLGDGQLTPDSVLEPPSASNVSESGSSTCLLADLLCPTLACTATTEIVKKKRSNLSVPRSGLRSNVKPVIDIPNTQMRNGNGSPIKATPVCGYEVEPALEDTKVLTNCENSEPVCGYEVESALEDTEVLTNCENSKPVCAYEVESAFEDTEVLASCENGTLVCGCEDEPDMMEVDTEVLTSRGNGSANLVRPVCRYGIEPGMEVMNRRKGAPRRAPLY